MKGFIKKILDDAADMPGESITPAENSLNMVNGDCVHLDEHRAQRFHKLVAKVLFLCKRARPDISTTIVFLTTRVKGPDEDDWEKLARCVKYLRHSKKYNIFLFDVISRISVFLWRRKIKFKTCNYK